MAFDLRHTDAARGCLGRTAHWGRRLAVFEMKLVHQGEVSASGVVEVWALRLPWWLGQ